MSRNSKFAAWQSLTSEQPSVETVPAPAVADVPALETSQEFEVAPEMKEWVESTAPAEESLPADLKKVTKKK